MANITETNEWEENIYLFDLTDPIEGGEGGVDNLPHKQLAARTQYLKAQIEDIFTSLEGEIDADTLGGYDLAAIKSQIIDEITNGASSAYDTLLELQQAIEANDGDISGILSTLAQKANLAGSATQRFKVAAAEADDEAINKGQLDEAVAGSARLLNVEWGYIAHDYHIIGRGIEYNRADYPVLWAAVEANGLYQDEASWQIDNTTNGMNGLFSSGDGSATFRSPNLDGAVIKADSTRSVGGYEADDVKSHEHDINLYVSGAWIGWQGQGPQSSAGDYCSTKSGYIVGGGGAENKVKNIALLPLIVAK